MVAIQAISLTDIVELFRDEAGVHGSAENCVVKHVVTRSKKNIRDHTLLFHLDKQPIHGKYYEDNEAVVIVTDEPEKCRELGRHITLIQVADIGAAYWQFVRYYRSLFQIPVIGITGTSGKTTTKEMIKHILSKDYTVQATYRNINSMSENLRYLLGIDGTTEAAVFEMPVAGPRYLSDACEHFQPNIRLLLNIGVYHLTDCGTPEEYFKAKTEILEGLDPTHGVLILNRDDENVMKVDVGRFHNIIYFGLSESADIRAANVQFERGGMSFTLHYQRGAYEAYVPGYGKHNVCNALAAVAATCSAGVEVTNAINRLATFKPIEEHLEFRNGPEGYTVIDDTWNTTPLSMAAALEVLDGVSGGRMKIAILGYMPRLGNGEAAQIEYATIGRRAVEANVDRLIVVGDEAREIGRAALALGMDKDKVRFCTSGEELYQIVQPYLNDSSTILLKVTHREMEKPSFVAFKERLLPDTD